MEPLQWRLWPFYTRGDSAGFKNDHSCGLGVMGPGGVWEGGWSATPCGAGVKLTGSEKPVHAGL